MKKPVVYLSSTTKSDDAVLVDLVAALREVCPNLAVRGTTAEVIASVHEDNDLVPRLAGSGMLGKWRLRNHLGPEAQRIHSATAKATILVGINDYHRELHTRITETPVWHLATKPLAEWSENEIAWAKVAKPEILGIYPSEPFAEHLPGVNYTYLGLPSAARLEKIKVSKTDLGLRSDDKIIAILGSKPHKFYDKWQKFLSRDLDPSAIIVHPDHPMIYEMLSLAEAALVDDAFGAAEACILEIPHRTIDSLVLVPSRSAVETKAIIKAWLSEPLTRQAEIKRIANLGHLSWRKAIFSSIFEAVLSKASSRQKVKAS